MPLAVFPFPILISTGSTGSHQSTSLTLLHWPLTPFLLLEVSLLVSAYPYYAQNWELQLNPHSPIYSLPVTEPTCFWTVPLGVFHHRLHMRENGREDIETKLFFPWKDPSRQQESSVFSKFAQPLHKPLLGTSFWRALSLHANSLF